PPAVEPSTGPRRKRHARTCHQRGSRVRTLTRLRLGRRVDPTMTKRALPESLRRAADTFDDYLRVERGASPRTIAAYRRDLRGYLDAVARSGVTDVRTIKPKHVTDAMQRRSRTGAAPTTLNRWLAAVRHFHKFCVREGI